MLLPLTPPVGPVDPAPVRVDPKLGLRRDLSAMDGFCFALSVPACQSEREGQEEQDEQGKYILFDEGDIPEAFF